MVADYLIDVDQRYLLRILNEANLNQYAKVGGQPSLSQSSIYEIEIPLPPLEIQQQIVAEIEGYQKIIDGAKQVVNNYKPTITINPDWEILELGTLAKLVGGSTPSKENSSYWENGNVDWITCSDFSNSPMYIEDSIRKITEKAVKENSTSIVPKDTLVLVTRVSLGKMAFVRKPTALNQDLTALLFDEEKINKRYGYFFMLSIADKIENDGHGATVKGVTRDYVKDIKVPLPSLEEQQIIVKAIEEEMQLVNANKRLVEIFEQKIKTKIGEVWGVKEEETLSMAAEPQTEYNK
jgi:type I restriction enzyme M protein